MSAEKIKAIVCGTTFGQFYCEALTLMPREIEFVGILSTGSERSKKCAASYGVKSYTSIDQLEDDIQLACVAVRSGVLGGNGTELAEALLERGINVIQEQPVHYKDAERCIRAAKKNKVLYRIGDLYEFLPNIKCFIESAKAICNISKPIYLDIGGASQVTYPLVRILSEALPSMRPFEIKQVGRDSHPFDAVSASIGGVTALMQIQNEVAPDDPDNFMHYLHRITIITEQGRLCLEDTTGGVVWYGKMFVPVHSTNTTMHDSSSDSTSMSVPQHIRLYESKEQSFLEVFKTQWIPAIAEDISQMLRLCKEGTPAEIGSYYTKTVHSAKVWQQLTAELGFPELIQLQKSEESDVTPTIVDLREKFIGES
ncbi:MAG: Gfo/Idh/MocA family oxidoreductase [Pseudobutyrivibrio sp.]|nr:Gfo/Idh/MocA family oxidoreductase [Pseudobutyrivibrio sp.]